MAVIYVRVCRARSGPSCALVVRHEISASTLLPESEKCAIHVYSAQDCGRPRLGNLPLLQTVLCADSLRSELLLDRTPRGSSGGQMESRQEGTKNSEEE